MKKIVSFSGGKDSTAMLIYLTENDYQVDEILYVDVGDWMWDVAKEHNKLVEKKLGVSITTLDVTDELRKGFIRYGFPSFMNRWCTGIKRNTIRDYLIEKHGEDESIVQYIGYCSDEVKRTSKKLYSAFDTEYPLVDANISTSDALQICKDYGFDFGGVYEHHHHFNCWLCPLQKRSELQYIFENEPNKWDMLRNMQHQTDGYYYPNATIFDMEKRYWEKNIDSLKAKRLDARMKYSNKRGVYKKEKYWGNDLNE